MRRVCAWCQKDIDGIDSPSETDADPISHGICNDCARYVLSFNAKSLQNYLNRFSGPVFLVGPEGRIITANTQAFSALGKKPEEIEGQLGGDAFECQYAKLPGGCGQTVHCKTCTIRLTVTDTLQSGRSHIRVAAYPDLHHVTRENRIRFLISTERVGNAVLLRIDEISEEKKPSGKSLP
ncbi:MAG: PAS domain-containing protein [Nitrospirota bacterium]|nr:PAS domain-containing protein [Nitrospirota bacterium]